MIRYLLALVPVVALAGWVEGTIIGVRDDSAAEPTVFFGRTSPNGGLAPGVWHDLDVTDWGMPSDTKAVFLQGLLIITGSTTQNLTCNLEVSAKKYGDDSQVYVCQTAISQQWDGERSACSIWVPVHNSKFRVRYAISPTTDFNNGGCAFAANLKAGAYVR